MVKIKKTPEVREVRSQYLYLRVESQSGETQCGQSDDARPTGRFTKRIFRFVTVNPHSYPANNKDFIFSNRFHRAEVVISGYASRNGCVTGLRAGRHSGVLCPFKSRLTQSVTSARCTLARMALRGSHSHSSPPTLHVFPDPTPRSPPLPPISIFPSSLYIPVTSNLYTNNPLCVTSLATPHVRPAIRALQCHHGSFTS